MTLEEMIAQRDALLAARYRGVRTVEIDGRRVTTPPTTRWRQQSPIWSGGLRLPVATVIAGAF